MQTNNILKTKFFWWIACISIYTMLLHSCETIDSIDYGIDPATEQDMLNRALRLNGKLFDGTMPMATGSGSIAITDYPPAIEVSAGVLIYLPYKISTDDICTIYFQVEGAESYWEVPIIYNPDALDQYLQIFVPNFVHEGDFNFIFSVADCDGTISSTASTNTIIHPAASCGDTFSGSVGITIRSIFMGKDAGTASITYNTYDIDDRIDVRQNGKWIASTGIPYTSDKYPECDFYIDDNISGPDGYVGTIGEINFDYDPDQSNYVEVYVSGCDDGTAWDITVNCPE